MCSKAIPTPFKSLYHPFILFSHPLLLIHILYPSLFLHVIKERTANRTMKLMKQKERKGKDKKNHGENNIPRP